MKDYIVRATAANAQIRAFAASTTELVEEARTRHNTSPVSDSSTWTTSYSRCDDGKYDEESDGCFDAAGAVRRSDRRDDSDSRQ